MIILPGGKDTMAMPIKPVPSGGAYRPGDIVYFRYARKNTNLKQPVAQFKGHGFGMFMGHVPPGAPEPHPLILIRQMAASGFISFDDVIEFLGKETGDLVVKKCTEKYWPESVVKSEEPSQEELPHVEKP